MNIKNISCLPALILMVVIFCFSSKPATVSNESSLTIADDILEVYQDITDNILTGEQRVIMLDTINHIVRKGAHFTEYAVLACTILFHFLFTKEKGKGILILSIALTALYAVTDEIHQLFVPGRSGQLTDVLLDTAGGITGALLFSLFYSLLQRVRERRKGMINSEK